MKRAQPGQTCEGLTHWTLQGCDHSGERRGLGCRGCPPCPGVSEFKAGRWSRSPRPRLHCGAGPCNPTFVSRVKSTARRHLALFGCTGCSEGLSKKAVLVGSATEMCSLASRLEVQDQGPAGCCLSLRPPSQASGWGPHMAPPSRACSLVSLFMSKSPSLRRQVIRV